jgi:hypothetical protein
MWLGKIQIIKNRCEILSAANDTGRGKSMKLKTHTFNVATTIAILTLLGSSTPKAVAGVIYQTGSRRQWLRADSKR